MRRRPLLILTALLLTVPAAAAGQGATLQSDRCVTGAGSPHYLCF
jgi:hypothetical protein